MANSFRGVYSAIPGFRLPRQPTRAESRCMASGRTPGRPESETRVRKFQSKGRIAKKSPNRTEIRTKGKLFLAARCEIMENPSKSRRKALWNRHNLHFWRDFQADFWGFQQRKPYFPGISSILHKSPKIRLKIAPKM